MNIEMNENEGRHSFTLESNGFRLVFKEKPAQYKNQPYSHRFGIVSLDSHGNYAHFGIGKMEKNDCTSFPDAIEKQLVELDRCRDAVKDNIEYFQRKLNAINEFMEYLPKLFLENGLDETEVKDDGEEKDKK